MGGFYYRSTPKSLAVTVYVVEPLSVLFQNKNRYNYIYIENPALGFMLLTLFLPLKMVGNPQL